MIDLTTLVVFCNCTIAIAALILTFWTVRLRQQLVAIAQVCDRLTIDCSRSSIAPEAILDCREQIRHLRQIYQQQVMTTGFAERRLRQQIQAIGLFIQIARSVILKRSR